MAELKITKGNFEKEVKNSDIPVLLDFWAPWCGPCRMVGPIVEEIAKEYDGKIKVGKINVDEETALASAFNIASIPTLMVVPILLRQFRPAPKGRNNNSVKANMICESLTSYSTSFRPNRSRAENRIF